MEGMSIRDLIQQASDRIMNGPAYQPNRIYVSHRVSIRLRVAARLSASIAERRAREPWRYTRLRLLAHEYRVLRRRRGSRRHGMTPWQAFWTLWRSEYHDRPLPVLRYEPDDLAAFSEKPVGTRAVHAHWSTPWFSLTATADLAPARPDRPLLRPIFFHRYTGDAWPNWRLNVGRFSLQWLAYRSYR